MNISKIFPKSNVIADFAKNKSAKATFEAIKDTAVNTASHQVPTYELRLAAKQADKNVLLKAVDSVKTNKKIAAIIAGVVVGLTLVAGLAKKVIKKQK